MAKRGRPRKPKFELDYGTPELQSKRLHLVGRGDPSFAEHPLGVLHVRGYLCADHEQSRRLYAAGMEFGILWGKVFKPPFAESLMANYMPGREGGDWDDSELALAEARLRAVATHLKERQIYDALVNVVVYRRAN